MARVLILCLRHCGHHMAALAIDAALHRRDPSVETMCVDPINYSHPRISALIHSAYMAILKGTPDLWEAIYDSPGIDRLTRRFRWLVQRAGSGSFLPMMREFAPDAVVCTQALAFSAVAAYQEERGVDFPLFGVVTDFLPHRFWLSGGRGVHIVPTEDAAQRLRSLGADPTRIRIYGIPVNPAFLAAAAPAEPPPFPRVLVMGGTYGLGIQPGLVRKLDAVGAEFEIEVVCGRNQKLRRQLQALRGEFRHRVRIRGFVRDMARLMRQSSLLVGKPGGLTSSEAMIAGLPMVIVKPLPGQETGNTRELVRHGVAVHLARSAELGPVVRLLLTNRELLRMMSLRARALARPDAADRIAADVLASIGRGRASP